MEGEAQSSGIVLSREQVRAVDLAAVSKFHINSLILMENAGRGAAEIVDRVYGPSGRALILCGTGNNGGDGLVIARHLSNRGWRAAVAILGTEEKLSDDALANFRIARAMELEVTFAPDAESQQAFIDRMTEHDVLIDAMLGTGFSGDVRSPVRELIRAVNDGPKRAVVAIDVPSGLDCDAGTPSSATIVADLTITFVAVKRGMLAETARPFVGRIEVADIGAPNVLIERIAGS